jgi:hypothetical protein
MKTGIRPRKWMGSNFLLRARHYLNFGLLWSWCRIHNAHLEKIPSFCKILDPKITHLEKNFDYYFCLISAIVIQTWHSKVKTIILLHRNCMYFIRGNSQKLRQKYKWVLWMRHLFVSLIYKAHLHFWCKFYNFSPIKYIQFCEIYKQIELLNAKAKLQWQMLN